MLKITLAPLAAVILLLAGCAPAVLRAARSNDAAAIKKLADEGADLNATGIDNVTPLMSAAGRNNVDAIEALLQNGADPNAATAVGTPIGFALMNGAVSAVKLLLDAGAVYTAADRDWARRNNRGALVQLMDEADRKRLARMGGSAPAPSPAPAPAAPRPAAPAAAAPAAPASDVDEPSYRTPERPRDFAVVIGIDRYERLPPATNAERDAAAVRKHFKALGVPERNIISLTGSKATRSQISAYLDEWLPRNVGPESRLYFYYSGHGAPDPKTGQAFLVPADADPTFLQSTGYPVKQLYERLGKLKAKQVLVVLDACFSGAGGRSVLAAGARPLVSKVEDMKPAGAVTVFAAASADEITGSFDEKGHGLFTYFFLKGLSAGKRTSAELQDYLKPQVQDEARRQNREQTPVLFGSGASL
jgi:hypothetical protein